MSPDLTENIINPKDALAIAEVLRGDNPATAPISNEAAQKYKIPQSIRFAEPLDLGDLRSSGNVVDGREMSW